MGEEDVKVMIAKTFEVRDRNTFIPVLAVKMQPSCEPDRYLFSRTGYGISPEAQSEYVLLMRIDGGEGKVYCDPYSWQADGTRTLFTAHQYIIKNFSWLNSGDVICVEHILGEREAPKISERLDGPFGD